MWFLMGCTAFVTIDTAANPGPRDETADGRAVCARWNADRDDLAEADWSGDVASCEPGDMDADGRARALKLLNLYRFVADLPEVETEPDWDADAQECALMMDANGQLSHTPDDSWACYTAAGASAAGSANIASGPGVMAMDMYMQDYGNETTMGHRRWILSNGLGPVGIGSTASYSCLRVIGGSGDAGAEWMAWPPPGDFPAGAITAAAGDLNATGFTVQSDRLSLDEAVATVTDGGEDLPVAVDALESGYGSSSAIRITPDGWSLQTDHTYEVAIRESSDPIDYAFTVRDCD